MSDKEPVVIGSPMTKSVGSGGRSKGISPKTHYHLTEEQLAVEIAKKDMEDSLSRMSHDLHGASI